MNINICKVKYAVLRETLKNDVSVFNQLYQFNLKYDSCLIRKWIAVFVKFKYRKY